MLRKLEDTARADDQARPFVSLGLAFGLAAVLVFGLTLPMTRLALEGFGPFAISLGRAVPSGFLAIVLLYYNGESFPQKKHWLTIMLASAGVVFGFPVLMTISMFHLTAAHGGVMLAMLPLATAMAGALIAGERPSLAFWLAGIGGSALVVVFAIVEAGAFHLEMADLILIAGIAAAGVGYTYSGLLARDLGGLQAICWVLVFSLPVSIPLLWLFAEPVETAPSLEAIFGFVYVAVIGQFVGYYFWNKGMSLAGVARTGQLQLLQPFVTLPASALLLDETVGWRHIVFALAVVGVVAAGRRLRVGNGIAK
ncbi:MAG: DMT family transporter [Hyphomicrobiales bacterium]|nr:DMT family transporter [Hyphomicrobiales bacterium]